MKYYVPNSYNILLDGDKDHVNLRLYLCNLHFWGLDRGEMNAELLLKIAANLTILVGLNYKGSTWDMFY